MSKILVTGSSGLVGSELVCHFSQTGRHVYGIDNNMRADFFGKDGDTHWVKNRISTLYPDTVLFDCDIRNRSKILEIVQEIRPQAVIHAAAQPSHDLAAKRPFDDFDVNAVGTLNLLEAVRRTDTNIPFVFLSTNKVYGDGPNRIPLQEEETRWDYHAPQDRGGINEYFPIDNCMHSLFGASKLSADIMVQEYGRYFGIPTCCLRCGCITGPLHSGVELHGFLNYLIRCNVAGEKYSVFGYQGKQVRDNIHSYDVAAFIQAFLHQPRTAEVYNLGGGRQNSVSILEAFKMIETISGTKMNYEYIDQNRKGDHICYISDLSKARSHYPEWTITKDLPVIFEEIFQIWKEKFKN